MIIIYGTPANGRWSCEYLCVCDGVGWGADHLQAKVLTESVWRIQSLPDSIIKKRLLHPTFYHSFSFSCGFHHISWHFQQSPSWLAQALQHSPEGLWRSAISGAGALFQTPTAGPGGPRHVQHGHQRLWVAGCYAIAAANAWVPQLLASIFFRRRNGRSASPKLGTIIRFYCLPGSLKIRFVQVV